MSDQTGWLIKTPWGYITHAGSGGISTNTFIECAKRFKTAESALAYSKLVPPAKGPCHILADDPSKRGTPWTR